MKFMILKTFNQQSIESEKIKENVFPSLKTFLNENDDNPNKYLQHCFTEYKEKIRKKAIENKDISFLKDFVEKYRQFIFLDWQNLVIDLINANNKTVFDFFVLLKQKEILPVNLFDCFAFQKYQELISNKEKVKEFFKDDSRLKIKSFDSGNDWKDLEPNSSKYYVLNIECATYVRSYNSDEKKNVIDVSSDVVLTNGLSFKPALDKDEIVYLEVENV